jgi:hypothetical protein
VNVLAEHEQKRPCSDEMKSFVLKSPRNHHLMPSKPGFEGIRQYCGEVVLVYFTMKKT